MGCCASRTSVVHAAPPPYQAPQPPPPPPTKITPLSKPTFIYVKENLQTNIILSTDEYIDVLVDRNELRRGSYTVLDNKLDSDVERTFSDYVDNLENPKQNQLKSEETGEK